MAPWPGNRRQYQARVNRQAISDARKAVGLNWFDKSRASGRPSGVYYPSGRPRRKSRLKRSSEV
jgi:hypothetical protein